MPSMRAFDFSATAAELCKGVRELVIENVRGLVRSEACDHEDDEAAHGDHSVLRDRGGEVVLVFRAFWSFSAKVLWNSF